MVERKDRKEPFKIINVARFYPQKKGQDVLIKATSPGFGEYIENFCL